MVSSKTEHSRTKPPKPYAGFPLTAHPNGQWCKKIRGKIHFFGVWDNPLDALDNYNRQAADLHSGRQPRFPRCGAEGTVKVLANRYLASQQEKAKRGLITASHFANCLKIVRGFVAFVGTNRAWNDLRPQVFGAYRMSLYDRYGVHAITRTINLVRAMFKHAYENDLIDRPVKYGGQFDRPTLKAQRQSRSQRDRANGRRLFEAGEIRQMLDASDGQLHAMILLGINGGFGNTDCAELPIAAVDFECRVIEYERPKTAVQRTVPLWTETASALQHVLQEARPMPRKPEYEDLVFLTKFGNPWKKEVYKEVAEDTDGQTGRQEAVSPEFRKLLDRLGIRRSGVGFYALRHTFRTWADETLDQHAIHRIMGHVIPGMSGLYVEEIGRDRLRAVVEHIRDRLFATR